MPFYNIVPHETVPGQFERAAGLGDLALLELLSPAHSGNWVLGAGPTFIFPTATSHFTGQGKWQIGPSMVVGYLTKQFFIGVFPQQWWSIGGEHGRPNTNQMNLQPIAALFFGEGWSIGYSGNILADWTAPSEDVWTVPVGLGLGKVVKFGRLPVKIQLAVQYMPVHPRISGQEVERAGPDHSCPSEAYQRRPFPLTRKVNGTIEQAHVDWTRYPWFSCDFALEIGRAVGSKTNEKRIIPPAVFLVAGLVLMSL